MVWSASFTIFCLARCWEASLPVGNTRHERKGRAPCGLRAGPAVPEPAHPNGDPPLLGSHQAATGDVLVTVTEFRRLALSFPETQERVHMGHPDFRVAGKIFATLAWPAKGWSMVKLTPEQQGMFVQAHPKAFVPVKGAWGRRGCTNVHLSKARAAAVRGALVAAWLNTAPKRLAQALEPTQ